MARVAFSLRITAMRRTLTRAIRALPLVLLAAVLATGSEVPPEAPEPTFEARFAERLEAVRATRDPDDDLALAGEMLQAARDQAGDETFVRKATETVADLAGRLPEGTALADEALRMLAERNPDPLDALARRVEVWETAYRVARGPQRPKIAGALLEALIDRANAESARTRDADAAATYRQAAAVAASVRPGTRDRLRFASQRSLARAKARARLEVLEARLADDPDDAAARDEAVRLALAELDDPTRAAGVVKPGAADLHSRLVLVAGISLERLPERACLELGRWYEEMADEASFPAKGNVLERARNLLQRYLALHEARDEDRAAAAEALERVTLALRRLPYTLILPEGCVLALTFDRGTLRRRPDGTVEVRDVSPSRMTGTVHGATPTEGIAGEALAFDGADDSVALGNAEPLRITGDQTIAMWLLPIVLGARRNPLDKAYGGEGTWTLEADGRVNYYHGASGANAHPYTGHAMPVPVAAGQWVHLATVRDLKARTVRWYKNGRPVAEYEAAYPAAKASSQPLTLGSGYAGRFAGRMDEVAIFARALASDEVKALYEQGRSGRSLVP